MKPKVGQQHIERIYVKVTQKRFERIEIVRYKTSSVSCKIHTSLKYLGENVRYSQKHKKFKKSCCKGVIQFI